MAHEVRTKSADISKNTHPATQRHGSQSAAQSGPSLGSEGFHFDDRGMLLPHSILGTLDGFRKYLEMRGETEFVNQIPNSRRDLHSQVLGKVPKEGAQNQRDVPFGQRNLQANALQHWDQCIRQRKRQQNVLSERLHRPVENLLMNQDYCFKELQEQREILRRVLPLIQSGYGHRVGSEFWSLPQRYGNDLSGIRATLTQTEQGKRKPVTIIGQPHSILQESGITCVEMLRQASQILDPNIGVQQRARQALMRGLEVSKKDLKKLEVIGSNKPVVKESQSLFMEDEECRNKQCSVTKNEDIDPLAHYNDGQSNMLLIPAMRFAGQLASWTGSAHCQQETVGISTTVLFEAFVGERVTSQLEMSNVGSTALLFSWQQLPLPQHFSNLESQSNCPHFYFNTSSGTIYPGETQQINFIFKSDKPGIITEQWQLNTHPLLLQGASIQITLKGLSHLQDTTARQREFIKTKLEETTRLEICRMIVYQAVRGIQTPERSTSPAEPYTLQYLDQTEEELNKLLQEMNPEHIWDITDTSQQNAPLNDEMGGQPASTDKLADDEQVANCDDVQNSTAEE
ncbi:MYCBP-associated protein isoform X2 [Corythoichthys intestinalis]|uniref:MYCBP-associated protein isoform X2 n=1 Tax=Corythoichthys intestinalis TaxID=161448 RepID=UPI0025A64742|nr:MYCBP-associated protein isoform X2 [Corythoichthys intestinalis]